MANKELISAVEEASRKLEVAWRRAKPQHIPAMEHLILNIEKARENVERSPQNFPIVAQQVKASIDNMVKDINYNAKVPKTCCTHEPDVADVPEQPRADVPQDSGDLGVNDPETGEELERNMVATEGIEKKSTASPRESTVEQNMAAHEEMVECNIAAPEEMVEPSSVATEESVERSLVAPEETLEHEDAQQSD